MSHILFKKIIPMLLLASIPFVAKAQSYVVEVPYSAPIQNSIVRELPDSNIVSYVETSTDHWITFAKTANTNVEKIQIPSDIFIKDLYVHNEFVYFCGYNANSGLGVWGWFDNNASQMAANGLIYYDNFNCNSGNTYVEEFKKLVVYMRGANTPLHIALVGSANDIVVGKRACTVSISGTVGIANGWNYTIGLSPDPTENLTNICLTDSYVVAAGVAGGSLTAELYRIHNRYSMWTPQADRRYYFTFGPIGSDHDFDEFALTHVGGDTMAAATPCLFTSPLGILLNVYDLQQTLSAPNGIHPVFTSEYNYLGNLGQFHVKDLRYSAANNLFSILMTGNFACFTENTAIAQIAYPGGIVADFYTRDKMTSYSMDNFISQSRFISLGRDDNNTSTSLYFTQPYQNLGNCSKYYSYPLVHHYYASKSDPFSYITCDDQFDCITQKVSIVKEIAKTFCE